MSRRALAAFCALVAILANIAGQRILMNIGLEGQVLTPGLADLRPEWNRGVSFSLMTQNSDMGRYLLIALLALIATGVAILAWRATSFVSAAGYGLIVGGAVGNLVDRTQYGAVFDFLALHIGSMPLFVCNLADFFISVGVVLLILDMILPQAKDARDFAG